MDTDLLYQRIGEFVVSFQWIEHRLREMGWLITDPERKVWPPRDLREESNSQLLDKIEEIYINFIKTSRITDKENKTILFKNLIVSLHQHRKYRNQLLHSAFIELKGGGEIMEVWRSNPKLKYEGDNVVFDTKVLTPDNIQEAISKMANDAFTLNIFYSQALQLAGDTKTSS